ncbi:MAG: NAD-dependent deacylase [Bacteroidales bacterium]|nr:NAD-dependent deacylase [Bacteroidales bacterium]
MKKHLVILSGAGVSAESGIKTFRDMGGLWEQYNIEEVASPIAWQNNQGLVLEFYNQRRKQLLDVIPNRAHYIIAELEKCFKVTVITQNVDDLHERAGSTNVLHLHGELKKVRSTVDENLIYELNGWELKKGDLCKKGSQLRPHIVWFGEAVPKIEDAASIVKTADFFLVVGTSLNVYPAAGLIYEVPNYCPIYLIDPNEISVSKNVKFIREKASIGMNIFKRAITCE